MNDRELALNNIAEFKSKLADAERYFNENYGNPDIEAKVISFLSKRDATVSEISRNVRSFGRLNDESKRVMMQDMVSAKTVVIKTTPTLNGRGRPKTSYFLLEQE